MLKKVFYPTKKYKNFIFLYNGEDYLQLQETYITHIKNDNTLVIR